MTSAARARAGYLGPFIRPRHVRLGPTDPPNGSRGLSRGFFCISVSYADFFNFAEKVLRYNCMSKYT